MDFTLYWFMFPVAILVATCAMLSGIGGAALFTPIFILLFPLLGPEYVLQSTMTAVAAALFTQTFGFLSGFIGYWRRKLIDYGLAVRFLRISVPLALIGALTASLVRDGVLLAGYAVLVFTLAFGLWFGHMKAPHLKTPNAPLTAIGAFMTGMVSVGIGEVTVAQLTRRGIPIAVAAATSVMVVIVTVLVASTTLIVQLINDGGWTAVPWNLLVYDVPGVLIGGQIGPLLAGRISQRTMQRAIAVLFMSISIAMASVAVSRWQLPASL
jgi:uncharacterized membrane protein YfcA